MSLATRQARVRAQNHWRNRRARWLAANGPCRVCGSTQDLQIDHVDPNTKVSHRIWAWAAPRRRAELAKCQVLCSDCHHKKTERDNNWKRHGTYSKYVNFGCRCAPCVHAARLYRVQYRARARREGVSMRTGKLGSNSRSAPSST